MIDLKGQKFGRLMPIEYIGDSKWKCICDCGNTTIARTSNLRDGSTKSCGCLKRETDHRKQRNAVDYTGKKTNMLTAIKYLRSNKNGTVWQYKCDCGNYIELNPAYVNNGIYKSCGCIASKAAAQNLAANCIEETNISKIKPHKPIETNKSGVTGVFWDNRSGKWKAKITFQKKSRHLGYFDNFEDAVKARQRAEEELFEPFLEKHKGE